MGRVVSRGCVGCEQQGAAALSRSEAHVGCMPCTAGAAGGAGSARGAVVWVLLQHTLPSGTASAMSARGGGGSLGVLCTCPCAGARAVRELQLALKLILVEKHLEQ